MPTFNFSATEELYNAQNALLLAKFAQLAYQKNFDLIKSGCVELGFDPEHDHFEEFTGRMSKPPIDTQCFMAVNRNVMIIAFRGSEPKVLTDWLTDLNFSPQDGPGKFGKVHRGFAGALDIIFAKLLAAIVRRRDNGQAIWFTGHSLGGALAVLAAWRLIIETKDIHFAQGIYTFGQPCTGGKKFVNAFNKRLKSRTFRFVNHNDAVPRSLRFVYDHTGQLFYFDRDGRLNSQSDAVERFIDKLQTAVEDLRHFHFDGALDHYIDSYIKNLEGVLKQVS